MYPIEDRVAAKCANYLDNLDTTIKENSEVEEWYIEFVKEYVAGIVIDIMIHFSLVPYTEVENYESRKRNMWISDYCKWALAEINEWDNWDINFIKTTYDIDLKNLYTKIFNDFLSVC